MKSWEFSLLSLSFPKCLWTEPQVSKSVCMPTKSATVRLRIGSLGQAVDRKIPATNHPGLRARFCQVEVYRQALLIPIPKSSKSIRIQGRAKELELWPCGQNGSLWGMSKAGFQSIPKLSEGTSWASRGVVGGQAKERHCARVHWKKTPKSRGMDGSVPQKRDEPKPREPGSHAENVSALVPVSLDLRLLILKIGQTPFCAEFVRWLYEVTVTIECLECLARPGYSSPNLRPSQQSSL